MAMRIEPKSIAFSVVLLLLTAKGPEGAGAEPLWLKGDEISSALAGKTLEGRYATGRAFTERYRADGRVEYFEPGGVTAGGRWSITAGTFCTIYDGDSSGGCFLVARVARNCFEFFFATRTEEDAMRRKADEPSWTARGSVAGEASACHDTSDV